MNIIAIFHGIYHKVVRVRVQVFNATFNNISVISWRSVLLVEETRVPGENHWPVASHWQALSRNVVPNTPRLSGIRTQNSVVIGTDYISSCKSHDHDGSCIVVRYTFYYTISTYDCLLSCESIPYHGKV